MQGEDRSADDPTNLANLFFEAGKYYSWNGESQIAVDLLRKARALDPKNHMVLFYLADNLRVLSYSPKPPYYISEQAVYETRDVWNEALGLIGSVDADNAWVYVARANICRQVALLGRENDKEQYWQAILFVERALLLNDHPGWWVTLSDSYNGVALYANMLRIAAKTVKETPDDLVALEGRATVLVNTGQLEPARDTIKKLLEHKATDQNLKSVYQSWEAVVDYYLTNYEEALSNVTPRLEQAPDDLWAKDLRLSIYLGMGNHESALQDAQWIWDRREDSTYRSEAGEFARAAFWLGKFDETLARCTPLLDSSSSDDRFGAQLWCGAALLAQGEFPKADEVLFKALPEANPRTILDLIFNLERLLDCATRQHWTLQPAISEYLTKPQGILECARSNQVRMTTYTGGDPIKELEYVISGSVTGIAGSSSWLAAQASLGRLHLEENQLAAAEQAYEALSLYSEIVPEAEAGLNKVRAAEDAQPPAETALM
jgi:Flp pilus assembly protein TadD